MYGKHHTEEAKEKIRKSSSENSKGNHWYTDGTVDKFCKECPDGFHRGRCHFKEDSKIGKYKHKKGVKQKQYKWLTPGGEIVMMDMANAHKHHKDWILIEQV